MAEAQDPMAVGARPAHATELAQLAAIVSRALVEKAGERGAAQASRWEWAVWKRPKDTLAELLRSGLVVVGTIDEMPFGVAAARLDTSSPDIILGRIEALYVEPEAREVGVGAAMMARLADDASAAGCHALDAVALPGDRETKNFFESFGLKARLLTVHTTLPLTE